MQMYQVDAFTDVPFAGNPAAVCLLTDRRDDAWMQQVAREMNLSETAYLRRQSEGVYGLRWFTPACEVDLCGHATLASAHVLWSIGALASDETARFATKSGPLEATRRPNGWIAMDFPTTPATSCDAPVGLFDALGLDAERASFVGRSVHDVLVHVDSAATVRAVTPSMEALRRIDTRGVIVTASADDSTDASTDDGVDFVSRFFAPAAGVDEDPVTGSAHCALAPYWANVLGTTDLVARQVSARGGTLRLHLESPDADRVTLHGQAVTTLDARLCV